jgi:transposase-like protein
MSVFKAPQFHDEQAARLFVEAHLWPTGPVCPHCGACDRIIELKGAATKPGTRKCGHCRKMFSVTKGTVFESSHVPLHKWLVALYLLCSCKKGISTHQLHRTLGVTLKTAWFISHRIREAMRDGTLAPLGGIGKVVEADETFLGDKGTKETRPGWARGVHHKRAVVSLVERGGKVRSIHADRLSKAVIGGIVRENVDRESRLMTDEARHYHAVGREFVEHGRVEHGAGIYVDRTDPTIHTNTAEGFFGLFKRSMKGIYQHCAEKHLHRYLAEFDFRYNNRVALGVDDSGRALKALEGIKGKRLTYRGSFLPT